MSKQSSYNQIFHPSGYIQKLCPLGIEIGSATMLTTNRLAGVTPEVNFREHITCMPLQSVNEAAHSVSKNQGRCHQKFKTGVSVGPTKRTYIIQNFFLISSISLCIVTLPIHGKVTN